MDTNRYVVFLLYDCDYMCRGNWYFSRYNCACNLSFLLLFGMGPGVWLIPSEVFSTTIRAKAISLATFANRVTAKIVISTFLQLLTAFYWKDSFQCWVLCVFWFSCTSTYTFLRRRVGRLRICMYILPKERATLQSWMPRRDFMEE